MPEPVVFAADFDSVAEGQLPSRWAGAGRVVREPAFNGRSTLYMIDSNPSGYAEVNTPPARC